MTALETYWSLLHELRQRRAAGDDSDETDVRINTLLELQWHSLSRAEQASVHQQGWRSWPDEYARHWVAAWNTLPLSMRGAWQRQVDSELEKRGLLLSARNVRTLDSLYIFEEAVPKLGLEWGPPDRLLGRASMYVLTVAPGSDPSDVMHSKILLHLR